MPPSTWGKGLAVVAALTTGALLVVWMTAQTSVYSLPRGGVLHKLSTVIAWQKDGYTDQGNTSLPAGPGSAGLAGQETLEFHYKPPQLIQSDDTPTLAEEFQHWNLSRMQPLSQKVTNLMIDTFKVKLGPLLADYKNPCWMEPVSTKFDYQKTYYGACMRSSWKAGPVARGVKAFNRMTAILQQRPEKEGFRWRLRCFPHFFLLGVTKCGTTSLFDTMEVHVPEFAAGAFKEYQYWDAKRGGAHCRVAPVTFSSYVDSFDIAAEKIRTTVTLRDGKPYHPLITGDFSPATLTSAPQWSRKPGNRGLGVPKYITAHYLKAIHPGVKLVVIMRDPVNRYLSHYRMHGKQPKLHNKYAAEKFESSWKSAETKFKSCERKLSPRRCSYNLKLGHEFTMLTKGLYDVYVRDWLAVYPRHQFLFLRTEDYQARPLEVMQTVFTFLGMANMTQTVAAGIMAKASKPHSYSNSSTYMSAELRQRMRDFYHPHNHKLAELIGDTAFTWGY